MASVANVEPGDVLVFTSDGSHVDKIITLLSNSDVAHSALYYGKNEVGEDILVDAATSHGLAGHLMQVGQGQIAPTGKTPLSQSKWDPRDIYVRRLATAQFSSKSLFPSGVLDAAKDYVLENNGFNWMGLIAVALHLLFRMGPRLDKVARLLHELLEMLTTELSALLPHNPGAKGPHPMYCSQFVCQCFTDGGFPLRIVKRPAPRVASITMLDWIASSSIAPDIMQAHATQAPHLPHRTADAIVADLLKALSSDVGPLDTSAAKPWPDPSRDLVRATLEFGLAVQQVQEARGTMNFGTGLHFLVKLENQYVAPADLKDNCSNLKPIGSKIRISRNQDSCAI